MIESARTITTQINSDGTTTIFKDNVMSFVAASATADHVARIVELRQINRMSECDKYNFWMSKYKSPVLSPTFSKTASLV